MAAALKEATETMTLLSCLRHKLKEIYLPKYVINSVLYYEIHLLVICVKSSQWLTWREFRCSLYDLAVEIIPDTPVGRMMVHVRKDTWNSGSKSALDKLAGDIYVLFSPRATCTPHQPMWGFLKTYFFWHFHMSKIRIRMLDDYNLPPEIDISTQRWHVLMRQNHDLSHTNSSHMPTCICSTLMDNISSQITIFTI